MARNQRDRKRRATPVWGTESSAGAETEATTGISLPIEDGRLSLANAIVRSKAAPRSDGPQVRAGGTLGRLRLVVGLLTCGYVVLSLVWALSNPAPSGTDEAAHYIKALATAQGELVGPHALFPFRDPNFPGVVYYWDQSTFAFRVPAKQAPASTFQCTAGGASVVPATCVSGTRCGRWAAPCVGSPPVTGDVVLATYVGDYVPTMYLVPGLLALLANNDVNGLRLARVGALLLAAVLVTLAMILLIDSRRPGLSLVGLFISVTPTAIYMNSVLNPNGGEIAAGICFAAAMIRLWRDAGTSSRWVWLTAGASGLLLGFSRAYGPLWIAFATAAAVLLIGIRPALRTLRKAGWPALLAAVLVAAGVLADLIWWKVVGVPKSRTSLLTFPRYIDLYVNALPQIFEQQIGLFGWMDIPLGPIGYIIWSFMVLAVLSLALLVASRRQRALLVLLIASDVIVTVLLSAVMRVAWDFPGAGQVGRYFLPMSVVITLLSGEILARNSARLGALAPRNLLIYVGAGAGLCQGIAIWMAARRFAVGVNGPLFFLPHSQWSPHFGWVPWLTLAALGCLMIATAGLLAVWIPAVPDVVPASGDAGRAVPAA